MRRASQQQQRALAQISLPESPVAGGEEGAFTQEDADEAARLEAQLLGGAGVGGEALQSQMEDAVPLSMFRRQMMNDPAVSMNAQPVSLKTAMK